MRISVGPGTYVVAVSGGVDSMVLLDLLRSRPGLKLIIAHFDHGIRSQSDSAEDRKLVQNVAKRHGLPFVYKNGNLGAAASSADARVARYAFLQHVLATSGAQAIITAHHQDDVLETAILNLLRGSGRLGLTSLKDTDKLRRPLLGYTKEQLRDYAATHDVVWHEDASNATDRYKRNYIRHAIVPRFSAGQRAQLLILIDDLRRVNHELDHHLTDLLHTQPALNVLDRRWFIGLPHDVAKEVAHTWLSRHGSANLTRGKIERLVIAMKTGRFGQRVDIDKDRVIAINKNSIALVMR